MIDFSKLDKTIHERGRLSIMTLLAARSPWTFQEIKAELGLSDGNLITHLRSLEIAGHIHSARDVSTTPRRQTHYALTKSGRLAFDDYLAVLESIIQTGKS